MIEGDERAPTCSPTHAAHVIAIATTDDLHHFVEGLFLYVQIASEGA
jgi:hypothetical protein